ncbi:MAG: outer membrane lipoprotein carrier protein LolA [Bacilli bacterium]|nr:outer membrane lipoprotein carrier protein LolA [Bacilli bacterium]
MKKWLLIICMMFMLGGCGKETPENVLSNLKKEVTNIKSYKITGNMEISNDEETFTYSLESYYLKDNYYKVILVNQTNNHEQIILKNNDDIYVITPALNKSFKFQSEWPGNSSQAYLLGNIIKDIENDAKTEVTESENGYIIKTSVNYPNNDDLKYQKIYLNDKKMIEKVEVYDENDIVKIKVTFDNMDLKAGLKENDFKLEEYIKEQPKNENNNSDEKSEKTCENDSETSCEEQINNNETSDNTTNDNTLNNKTEETTNIENIIYPLYIPSNTYLTSSETIETGNGNRVILTFSGEKNFVLIEEATIANSDMEIVPVYGEPLLLSESIGALSANSLSWDVNNISYYLASTELTVSEMQSIANSLGNTTLVSNTK